MSIKNPRWHHNPRNLLSSELISNLPFSSVYIPSSSTFHLLPQRLVISRYNRSSAKLRKWNSARYTSIQQRGKRHPAIMIIPKPRVAWIYIYIMTESSSSYISAITSREQQQRRTTRRHPSSPAPDTRCIIHRIAAGYLSFGAAFYSASRSGDFR